MQSSHKSPGIRHKGPKEIDDCSFMNPIHFKVLELPDPRYTCVIVSRGTISSVSLIKNVRRDR